MKKDCLKQRIYGHVELRKSLITALVVLIGGLAALFVSLDNVQKIILLVLGIGLTLIDIMLIISLNKDLEKFYKNMEE